ncbi:MAG: enoyl-CoA hydratase/isomerase family protein [Pseudorhodoplanes sp.]
MAEMNADRGAPFEELIFEVKDGVAFVSMNRPKVLNARNRKLRQELIRAYDVIETDPGIVVGVLTGTGEKSFCVGMDLKEANEREEDPVLSRWERPLSDAAALEAVSKPMIAAINGYALGGGLEIALCCDIRIAAEHALLGLPEATRGIMPGSGGSQRLPRLLGPSRAMEFLMTGDSVTAAEAYRIGLVNQIVPGSQLREATEAMARRIMRSAPVALRLIKEAVRKGMDMTLAQGVALERDLSNFVSTTEDAREGVRAFVEKRPPVWRGR